MRNASPARQRRSRWARWGERAALYISRRKLTTNAAAIATRAGESAATSWQTMSCAIPENENTESASPSGALMPEAIAATPATKPNGIVPRSAGAISRQPAQNSLERARVSKDRGKSASVSFVTIESFRIDRSKAHEEARAAPPRRERMEPREP